MDLSNAIAAEEAGSTEAETTTTSTESEIPFEANESSDGYALFGNSASLVEAISVEVYGNDPVYSLLEWGMDLEDYEELVEENDLNGQQKLDLLHKLAKSTFGGRQSELNEGYGMGWDTNESPPKPYKNSEVDHVPYTDVFGDLPAFEHRTLEGGEIEQLESEGLDMDDFGFNRSITGPQLPCFDGEAFPILYEDGDEVVKMLKMLEAMNIEDATYCPKNGSLQGTPTLGPKDDNEEVETEDGDTSGIDGYDERMEADELRPLLAENPTLIGKHRVDEVKATLQGITSSRTLKAMLQAEESQRNRSLTDNLESRIGVVEGDDEEEASEEEGVSDDEAVEGVEDASLEEVVAAFGLNDLEKQGVEYRVESGKADSYTEAAEQL